MSTTNIDRSLDDIIKDQRKLKKKAIKTKTQQSQKKGVQQRQGRKQTKATVANQKQGKRVPGKQNARQTQQRRGALGRRRGSAGKQNQFVQQGRGVQNNRRKQVVGNTNKGKAGGAKVSANRLKNKQVSMQKGKKILSKAKQIQINRRPLNRQNRQTQQKDARQNIINRRRGMQGTLKGNRPNKSQNSGTPKLQRINRRGNPSPQLTVSINNPRVRLSRTPQWKQVSDHINNQNNRRRWKGGRIDTGDLRISVPNNYLHQPEPLQPIRPLFNAGFKPDLETSATRKTFATLNERFSSLPRRGVRTIVVD